MKQPYVRNLVIGALLLMAFDATAYVFLGGSIGRLVVAQVSLVLQDEGSPLTERDTLNFTGAGVTCTDDAGNSRTNCDIPAAAAGAALDDSKAAASLATTENITLSGEQTIDGTLTSTSRVLVRAQTTQTENGLYATAAGAWARTTDADEDAEFVNNFSVKVLGGTLYGGTTWWMTTTGSITVDTTTITFTSDPKDVKTSSVAAASGVAPLGSDSNVPWTHRGGLGTHADLSTSSQIDPSTVTNHHGLIYVQSADADDTELLTGSPMIVGCDANSRGQTLRFRGISPTKTVTFPHATARGLSLCGAVTGSKVTVGAGLGDLEVFCAADDIWYEANCTDLQRTANVGRRIAAGDSNAVRFEDPDDATTAVVIKVDDTTGLPTIEGECSGSPCAETILGTVNWRKSLFVPADALTVVGCTLVTDQALVSGGIIEPYITCGDNDAHGFLRGLVMPDSWDGGTITVELQAVNVNASPANNYEVDFSGECDRNGTTIATTISATGEQPATLQFSAGGSCGVGACPQNGLVQVTTAAITLNGSCVGGDLLRIQGGIDATATTTAQVADVKIYGLKVEFNTVSTSD